MAKILPYSMDNSMRSTLLADSKSTPGYQLRNTYNETKVHRGHTAELSGYNERVDNKRYKDSMSEDLD